MKKFEYNGRNYKIVGGLVHKVDNSGDFDTLDPCYWGDNVIFDAHCEEMGLSLYYRPQGIHAYGNQNGTRSQ